MQRIRLIHWRPAEAEDCARRISIFGYEVGFEPLTPAGLRHMRAEPPQAVVIDLSRVPSQGRDLGLNLRKYKTTRHVPLIFVEGDPEKIVHIKELLPDAAYCAWGQIQETLEQVIASPPVDPIVPESTMAGYSGAPLPKKLGIKAGSVVALIGAPEGFGVTLGDLPDGAVITRHPPPHADLTLWFCRSQEDLVQGIADMHAAAKKGGLWIIWPQKASGVISDLSQNVVRQTGLASGLVDFRVCSVDATWSGLRFSQRKPGSQQTGIG